MTIDLSTLPQRVTIAVGGRRDIALPSYAGSGNRWSARCIGGGEVGEVRIESGDAPSRPPGDGTAEPPPPMLAAETAVVLGIAEGEATWRLELARSFGPRVPAATHDLCVIVTR
jgi:hypothetical protein